MALAKDTRLGSYEILAPIGKGGMGEVYLARDTKLDRQVAIKVLPVSMTRDPERIARFEREAKLLASLNHPNIAAVHGFDESNETHFLVMEYVEGETLAQRLKNGTLPVEDSLDTTRQVAEALEAAHEKGVIHRDLKPGNVMIRPDGTVKVLDFGLAKAMAAESSVSAPTDSPTITADYTRPGVILGTAAYMSPEQARGRALDKRTDIWSFGVILYECFTGTNTFHGETAVDSTGAILHKEPDWSLLPPSTPPTVQLLLRRCLTKDRKRRLHDIADARIELENAIVDPTSSSLNLADAALAAPSLERRKAVGAAILLGMVVGLVGGALGVSWWLGLTPFTTDGNPRVARFTIPAPPGGRIALDAFLPSVALTRDGRMLAYVCEVNGARRLFIRAVDEWKARPLAHTEGAEGPFFSPDGRWLGFFTDLKLKKISIEGGPATTLCDAGSPRGAVWVEDDMIVFTPEQITPLMRIDPSGGTPTPITEIDIKTGEYSHRWPSVLPDGETILHAAVKGNDWDSEAVWAYSLRSGARKLIGNLGTHVQFVKSGYLAHVQSGVLMASPFDVEKLEVTGSPTAIVQAVATQENDGASQFSVSHGGTLAFLSGPLQGAHSLPVIVDFEGRATPIITDQRAYRLPRVSPDGKYLLIWLLQSGRFDSWIIEIETGSMQRQTFGGSSVPTWHPNGREIAYAARPEEGGAWSVFIKSADGLGAPTHLPQTDYSYPSAFSPDGRWLAITTNDPITKWDAAVIDLEDGDRSQQMILNSPANEAGLVFSPDGKWIAYVSDELALNEIYVSEFPGGTGKWQVSQDGGTQPVWSRDGRKLFYRRGLEMMSVDITTEPSFRAGRPHRLFVGWYEGLVAGAQANFDVLPDGKGFVMIQPTQMADEHTQIHVVVNWAQELLQGAASNK